MARSRLTSGTIAALMAMWERGMGAKELAEAAGVSYDSLWNYIRRHRDQFPHRNHHEAWWRERLAEVEGLSCSEAARRIGCSAESVSHWRMRLDDRR